MKKVISFSLWGKDPKYAQGAIENIKLAKEFYSQWICRIYHDETVDKQYIEDFKSYGAETILKPKSDGFYGMFWRFDPLKDKSIERFIIRDTDSRLSEREAKAVEQWEQTGKEFHIIRDHPHHGIQICGGLWGATSTFINRINYDKLLNNYFYNNAMNVFMNARGKYFYTDQDFLCKIIWPLIKDSHIAHDEYFKFTGKEMPFPIKRIGETFVGESIII